MQNGCTAQASDCKEVVALAVELVVCMLMIVAAHEDAFKLNLQKSECEEEADEEEAH